MSCEKAAAVAPEKDCVLECVTTAEGLILGSEENVQKIRTFIQAVEHPIKQCAGCGLQTRASGDSFFAAGSVPSDSYKHCTVCGLTAFGPPPPSFCLGSGSRVPQTFDEVVDSIVRHYQEINEELPPSIVRMLSARTTRLSRVGKDGSNAVGVRSELPHSVAAGPLEGSLRSLDKYWEDNAEQLDRLVTGYRARGHQLPANIAELLARRDSVTALPGNVSTGSSANSSMPSDSTSWACTKDSMDCQLPPGQFGFSPSSYFRNSRLSSLGQPNAGRSSVYGGISDGVTNRAEFDRIRAITWNSLGPSSSLRSGLEGLSAGCNDANTDEHEVELDQIRAAVRDSLRPAELDAKVFDREMQAVILEHEKDGKTLPESLKTLLRRRIERGAFRIEDDELDYLLAHFHAIGRPVPEVIAGVVRHRDEFWGGGLLPSGESTRLPPKFEPFQLKSSCEVTKLQLQLLAFQYRSGGAAVPDWLTKRLSKFSADDIGTQNEVTSFSSGIRSSVRTPLMEAASVGNLELCKSLIRGRIVNKRLCHRADIMEKDSLGRTAWHHFHEHVRDNLDKYNWASREKLRGFAATVLYPGKDVADSYCLHRGDIYWSAEYMYSY